MDEKFKEAIVLLSSPKARKRESGAYQLQQLGKPEAGEALFNALQNELNDDRTWAVQHVLILALGHTKYEPSLPYLIELIDKEFYATMRFMALGDAIFRLSILSKSIEETLKLIYSFDSFWVTYGAFRALALLKLTPSDNSILEIIKVGSDPRGAELVRGHPNDKKGLRIWVALASAGWKNELKTDFLNDCEKLQDQSLTKVVKSARIGKYLEFAW